MCGITTGGSESNHILGGSWSHAERNGTMSTDGSSPASAGSNSHTYVPMPPGALNHS